MTTAFKTPSRPDRVPLGDPLREENIRLAGRVQQLRRALEAAAQENRQLRRDLARAREGAGRAKAASRPPGSPPSTAVDQSERNSWIRIMLSDSHSRNP